EAPEITAADLLIGIGLDPVELLSRPWPYRQPIVNVSSCAVASEQVPFAEQVVGDVAAIVRRIATVVRPLSVSPAGPRTYTSLFPPTSGLAPDRVVAIVA